MPRVSDMLKPDFGGWFVRIKLPNGKELEYRSLQYGMLKTGNTLDSRIHFKLMFTSFSEVNTAEIVIPQAQSKIVEMFERGKEIVFQAGWIPETQDNTLTTRLVVEEVFNTPVGRSQSLIEVLATDSADKLWGKPLSKSWPPGTKASRIFEDVRKAVGLQKGKVEPFMDFVYENGYCHWGTAWECLANVALDCRSRFYVWQGRAYLMAPDKGVPSNFTLEPDTGLIKGQYELKDDGMEAWSTQMGLEEADRSIIGSLVQQAISGALGVGSLAGSLASAMVGKVTHGHQKPIYRLHLLLDPKVFPNAEIRVKGAEDLPQKEFRCRVLHGMFYNDGSGHNAYIDVVPIG